MLKELNEKIQKDANFIEVVADEREDGVYCIRMRENKYINAENHVLNVEDELLDVLRDYFKQKGKPIKGWNNSREAFWV